MDPLPQTSPAVAAMPPRRRSRRLVFGAAVLVPLLLVFLSLQQGWWGGGTAPVPNGPAWPPDPRLTYAGPFRNVHPDVKYVGDASCANCHVEIALSFSEHPMGRTFRPIAKVAAALPYDRAHHNPFEGFDSRFLVDRRGDRVWHRQTRLDGAGKSLFESAFEVHYAIGSGHQGSSFVTNRDGFLFQTPISWYAQKRLWDLSPGFGEGSLVGRPLQGDCFFCHSHRVLPRPESFNRFELPTVQAHGIGCERCHGPGDLHVKERGLALPKGPVDETIVNPSRLLPMLRDAVCEQCHLEGQARIARRGRQAHEFRPGLPLELFRRVFVTAEESEEEQRAVSHVEQMHLSRCYLGSSGKAKMGCVTCHNPHVHVGPEERVSHYRQSCLKCHEKKGATACSIPLAVRLWQNKQDSCVDCHMPRFHATDIPHTASTDHRILRLGKNTPVPPRKAVESEWPLRPFHGGSLNLADKEMARDLGMALVQLGAEGRPQIEPLLGRGLAFLKEAVRECPADVKAQEALGAGLLAVQRPEAALPVFQKILESRPGRERALVGAAQCCQALGQPEPARAYWRQAIALNPWMPSYRAGLAQILEQDQAWDELRPQCEAWVRLDPGNVEARKLRITCLVKGGRTAEARTEFATVRALQPLNGDALDAWFADLTR